MINIDAIQDKPNLQEEFAYRQIGAITMQVDPVDVSSSLEFVLDHFKNNPKLHALPIERNGVLIGILDRSQVEKMNESAWTRFWQKDLDAYIQAPLLSLRADDYIEKNIPKVLELNTEKGVRFFAVFYRKSFFGIVGLHEMLARTTDLRARDMAKARIVQQHLLEQDTAKKDPRYSVYTYNQMANEVGGDFFKDSSSKDGDQHIIACFDVSGKNVAASLSTMAIGSVFTALKYFELGDRFGEATTILMDKYIDDLTPQDMFITAALCYVDFSENTVLIQNCGHTPIYLFIPGEGGKVVGRTMNPNLPPLGMGIIESEETTGYKIPITKGLRIVLYTDGLTDMVTPDGVRYDDERTRALFTQSFGKNEAESKTIYEKAINDWISEAMLPDDITIMDIRFH
jgi:sigma-B regulation protein RsbU (phosphoserine phosphatase)